MGATERQFFAVPLVVDTLIDESDGDYSPGDLSLREALRNSSDLSHVTFDAALDGGTILLTLGELAITRSLSVDASSLLGGLTIDASGNDPTPAENNGDGSRIFNIDDGDRAKVSEVTMTGLTLTGGDIDGNGGAVITKESLTVTDSTITGNQASDAGGGVYAGGVFGIEVTMALIITPADAVTASADVAVAT
jgi:hypothetical protein